MNENVKGCLNKKYFIIGAVVAVIASIITTIALIAGNAWKKPIDTYVKGIREANIEILLSAFPDFITDEYKDEFLTEMGVDEESITELRDSQEDKYGENYKITYKVEKKEKIEEDDLKKVEKAINDSMNKSINVSAGYKAKVKFLVKGKDDSHTYTSTMYLYKIDGKWSFFPLSPSEIEKLVK